LGRYRRGVGLKARGPLKPAGPAPPAPPENAGAPFPLLAGGVRQRLRQRRARQAPGAVGGREAPCPAPAWGCRWWRCAAAGRFLLLACGCECVGLCASTAKVQRLGWSIGRGKAGARPGPAARLRARPSPPAPRPPPPDPAGSTMASRSSWGRRSWCCRRCWRRTPRSDTRTRSMCRWGPGPVQTARARGVTHEAWRTRRGARGVAQEARRMRSGGGRAGREL
jgi:hypothetical protein